MYLIKENESGSDQEPGIVLQITFDKMSPMMENFLYYLLIFLLSMLIYLYLIIIDFVTIRVMHIRQRTLNSNYPNVTLYSEIN